VAAATGEEAPLEGEAEGEEAAAEEAVAEAAADEEAPPAEETPLPPPAIAPPCHFTLTACAESEVHLGKASELMESQLGIKLCALEGQLEAAPAGEWTVPIAVLLKPAESATVRASLELPEALIAACTRLHLVSEDTGAEQTFPDLTTGGVLLDPEANPSGYTLLADLKSAVPLPASPWKLHLTSTAELAQTLVANKPQALSDAYEPNGEYRLCRLVLSAAAKASASVHITCSEPRASLTARILMLTAASAEAEASEKLLQTVSGLGCATLFGVGLDAPPPPPAKGQEPPPAVTIILECRVDELSALNLELPTKPSKPLLADCEPEGEPEPGLTWHVSAASAAAVTIVQDPAREQQLTTLAASWESAAPGRAVKAKAVRDTYLAELEEEAAAAEAAAAEAAAAKQAALEAAADAADAAEGAEEMDAAFQALEAEATAVAPEEVVVAPSIAIAVELPRVVRLQAGPGTELHVRQPEELETWRNEQTDFLEAMVHNRAEKDAARGVIKESRAAKVATLTETAKASRSSATEAYVKAASDREALLKKLLPPPPEPAEPVDPKAKGKKK